MDDSQVTKPSFVPSYLQHPTLPSYYAKSEPSNNRPVNQQISAPCDTTSSFGVPPTSKLQYLLTYIIVNHGISSTHNGNFLHSVA